MAGVEELAARVLLFLAPMYFANSSAMLLGGKTPLDLGKNFFDGKPLLGPGKTFRGTAAGITVGTISTVIIATAFPSESGLLGADYMIIGFVLSVGALGGDMAASFLKRRLGIGRGTQVLFLDQLDFVAGGIVLASPLYIPGIIEISIIIIATLAAHRISNFIAFKLRLKKVPW